MRKFVINYGILAASISIVLGLLNWFFIAKPYGVELSQTLGYLSIIAALLCIPLGIKYYRDKLNEGRVTFKEGFKIGIGITLVTSVIMFIYSALFFALAGDDFKAWQEKWAPEQELDQANLQIAEIPDIIINPWVQGVVMFLMIFLIGLIMNTVSSLALKK